jgi:hypothetical protein
MVSKTKTKTRKKGKQTRVSKKTKPAKKRGAKKTVTKLARTKAKTVSPRGKRSTTQRRPIASPSEQESKLLARDNSTSLSSSADTVGSNERQAEVQSMPSDVTVEDVTTDPSSDTEENAEDYNPDMS